MPFALPKRTNVEANKTSPLKVISPIIRKYDGHRQKKNKISLKSEDPDKAPNLKALLPKPTLDDEVRLEPELLSAVNPTASSTIKANDFLSEIALPVQEICAIARQAVGEAKHNAAKVVRHPRKKVVSSALNKRKLIRQGKIVESALELLRPELPNVISAREEAYAANYFLKVKSMLGEANSHIFDKFCIFLSDIESNAKPVVTLYKELKELFSPWPVLIEEFTPFLTSEQALECGVFMEHLFLTKIADFLALVDTHFAKTPYQIKKIHSTLEKLALEQHVTMKEVSLAITPLLKGNAVLTDYFMELLPEGRPPDHLLTDFEELDEEAMSDGSDDGGKLWERIELPAVRDPYGGDTCICSCHISDNEKFRARQQHCIPCSTRFINGKIFIRSGKLLRRATVVFKDQDVNYHRQRLMPTVAEPRKRKRSSSHGKDCLSPSKVNYISSDEFKSDMEEDDKSKIRLSKAQKMTRCKRANLELTPRSLLLDNDADLIVNSIKSESKSSAELSFLTDIVSSDAGNSSTVDTNKVESILPTSDRVIYLTPSEAEELFGIKEVSTLLKAELKETKLLEPSSEPDNISGKKMEDGVDPTQIAGPLDVDTCVSIIKEEPSTERQSPPVLSIPETEVIPAEVDPLLSVVERNIQRSSDDMSLKTSASGVDEVPWKLEEDRVILQTLQVETYCEETFGKISESLPTRSVSDIKKRFQELLNLMWKLKSKNSD